MLGLFCPGNLSMVFFVFLMFFLYAIVPVTVSACFVGALAKLIHDAVAAREIVVKKKGNK